MVEKKWFTRKEAADELGISLRMLDNYLSSREIPYYKYGDKKASAVRIKAADIEKFIEKSLVV